MRNANTNAARAKSDRRCVYLDPPTHRQAKIIAVTEGMSLTDYVTTVIAADVAKRARKGQG